MPKLIVPSESGDSKTVQLNPEGVAGAVASGAMIGKITQQEAAPASLSAEKIADVQRKYGEWKFQQAVDQQKNQQKWLENQSKMAMQQAAYNTAQSNAVKDLNQKSADIIGSTASPAQSPEN